MQLTLTRDNTATKGLIVASTDQTSAASFTLHKPTELEELSIKELTDGLIQISMVIGQREFDVKINGGTDFLFINAVDQEGQTITQISDTLSALFLDSNAGGGGTTDNTTPPFVPYKGTSGDFENSNIRYEAEPTLPETFKLQVGHRNNSIEMFHDGNFGADNYIKIGSVFPFIGEPNPMFILLDFINQDLQLSAALMNLGSFLTDRARIRLDEAMEKIEIGNLSAGGLKQRIIIDALAGFIRMGDIDDDNEGTKIYMDDVNLILNIMSGTQHRLDLEAANNHVLLSAQEMIYRANSANKTVEIGDVGNINNGNKIVIDDNNQVITLGANGVAKIDIQETGAEVRLGDISGNGNETRVTINDATQQINFNNNSGKYNFLNVPTYANNAAAITGGLVVGDIYKISSGSLHTLAIVT